jgi:hypothetical protein
MNILYSAESTLYLALFWEAAARVSCSNFGDNFTLDRGGPKQKQLLLHIDITSQSSSLSSRPGGSQNLDKHKGQSLNPPTLEDSGGIGNNIGNNNDNNYDNMDNTNETTQDRR